MKYHLHCAAAALLTAATVSQAMALTPPAADRPAAAAPAPPASGNRTARMVDWMELLPPNERIEFEFDLPDHDYLSEDGPPMKQVGSSKTNSKLNGNFVKIPGFVVPLAITSEGIVTEFLLVPYFGACIHIPPPPPNQIVYVKMQKGFRLRSIYDPQWITGVLSTSKKDTRMASASYTLAGQGVEPYEY